MLRLLSFFTVWTLMLEGVERSFCVSDVEETANSMLLRPQHHKNAVTVAVRGPKAPIRSASSHSATQVELLQLCPSADDCCH